MLLRSGKKEAVIKSFAKLKFDALHWV